MEAGLAPSAKDGVEETKQRGLLRPLFYFGLFEATLQPAERPARVKSELSGAQLQPIERQCMDAVTG